MTDNQVATYQISETFKITGRGIVFAGFIIEGVLSLGDYIEFSAMGQSFKRRILGIDGIRFSQPNPTNTGLLIKCSDEQEIEELSHWEPKGFVAKILTTDKQ